MIYNKKIKPSLIDQNIIGEYMKEKMISQTKVPVVQTQSELQKLSTKIFYNVVNFIYHYFFIIIIFIGISYYLYKRYVWYQEIKKNQVVQAVQEVKQDEQIKKYFDDIMDGTVPIKKSEQKPNLSPLQVPVQAQPYFVNGKKLDKVISGNNGYLNHLKHTFDTTQPHTSSMGRIQPNDEIANKTVRFAQGDFDAYGRNNLNPKTGETVVKQTTNNIDNQEIQAWESKSGSLFSSF
jgi:hypothetical protein